ncbi:MAG: carboxylating nicotinate-nucleotide diphosphorylase [Cyclobacteriaceae bacterium]|nr:carboxylating nicotinate-nucleotide diphosphorylase [Cyclobacteriaceae bacterium]
MHPVATVALPSYITPEALSAFIVSAMREDIGAGDVTSMATIPETEKAAVKLLVKDSGLIAGVDLARRIYEQVDSAVRLTVRCPDGNRVAPGDIVFQAEGSARTLLATERLVLNCMQRMSGIATYTHRLTQLLSGTRARLLDTRKTTPNFRLAEKWAVHIGGGLNHRFGLFDRIMIKDNHADIAGGVSVALDRAKEYVKKTGASLKIEVEARSLEEVRQIIKTGGADIILLDNMNTETLRKAVDLIGGACATEASGGITEENLRDVALTGVDFISMGALTHSVKSLDLSLKVMGQ